MPLPDSSAFFFQRHRANHNLHSFPTRRSSDLQFQPFHGRGRRSSPFPCTPRTKRFRAQRRGPPAAPALAPAQSARSRSLRSEEHTSELQSRFDLVCRLLLEKKKKTHYHLH